MSQDLNLNMKNIEKLMDNIPDNLKTMLLSLAGKDSDENSDCVEEKQPSHSSHSSESKRQISGKSSFDSLLNMETIFKLKGLLEKVDNSNDHRIVLINALRPFLRPSRQDKIGKFLDAFKFSNIFKEAVFLTKPNGQKEVKD